MTGEGGAPPGIGAASIIREAFEPLAGRRLLDIGCGAGALARTLADRGARVVGIDPNPQALAVAREAVPAAGFRRAEAESLPFADGSFDGAIFLNSLHHVPEVAMHRALEEVARVVEPAGRVVVVEALPAGSFFSALLPVEDETRVRTAAQEVLRRTVEDGMFEELRRIDYPRRDLFEDLDEFLARVVAVDPARVAAVAGRRSEIEEAFRRHARPAPDGRFTLEQPMRAHVLDNRA